MNFEIYHFCRYFDLILQFLGTRIIFFEKYEMWIHMWLYLGELVSNKAWAVR